MIKLETLTGNHDRNNFDCGIPELNLWLKQTAWQHHGRGLSRSFVALLVALFLNEPGNSNSQQLTAKKFMCLLLTQAFYSHNPMR